MSQGQVDQKRPKIWFLAIFWTSQGEQKSKTLRLWLCHLPTSFSRYYILPFMLNFAVSLSCGGTTANNNSYIVQTSTTSAPATPCTYEICPCSTDICRIRYDFTTHVLATQLLDTADATGAVTQGLFFVLSCGLPSVSYPQLKTIQALADVYRCLVVLMWCTD